CERLEGAPVGGAHYRLPTFAEASDFPARSSCLATYCRDGEELALVCPVDLLHAMLVHPYEEIDRAVESLTYQSTIVSRGPAGGWTRRKARRLEESLERV